MATKISINAKYEGRVEAFHSIFGILRDAPNASVPHRKKCPLALGNIFAAYSTQTVPSSLASSLPCTDHTITIIIDEPTCLSCQSQ